MSAIDFTQLRDAVKGQRIGKIQHESNENNNNVVGQTAFINSIWDNNGGDTETVFNA